MDKIVRRYFYRLTKISAVVFIGIFLTGFWLGKPFLYAFTLAYLLSYLFVASNFIAVRNIDLDNHKKFYRIFLISLAVRFVFMIGAVIFVLAVIKIHQIFFTVSFIISYIFHSVIEIIYINQILETDREG